MKGKEKVVRKDITPVQPTWKFVSGGIKIEDSGRGQNPIRLLVVG